MVENKGFTVHGLLKEYEEQMGINNIQFLKDKDEEEESKSIKECIRELKDMFLNEGKNNGEEKLKWHKAHEEGRKLWQSLLSCALNSIERGSKGNSKLFEYLEDMTKFEDLLYGLEPYYRDHTLHSLWVYFLGDSLLRNDLKNIYEKPNWYLFNDITKDKDIPELVEHSRKRACALSKKVDDHKDAIWCIIALCHDLGYSVAKLNKINESVQNVLKYFDVPDFRHVGYSLDVEHQYLVAQFLELMSVDVRIEPGENYDDVRLGEELKKLESNKKAYKKKLDEFVSIKCYRDDSTYWRLCRALERREHGILSAYLIYKVLGIFAESSVRGPGEKWGLADDETVKTIIIGDILFAIAQHEFEFAHQNELGSFADILIIADELEEFSRYGRQLMSREYLPTTAETSIKFMKYKNSKGGKEKRLDLGDDIEIEITYICKHKELRDFYDFFRRKAEQLCSTYSLQTSKEEKKEKEEKEKFCTIKKIKMIVKLVGEEAPLYWFCLSEKSDDTKAELPARDRNENGSQTEEHGIRVCDDKLYIVGEEITLKEYLKDVLKNEGNRGKSKNS